MDSTLRRFAGGRGRSRVGAALLCSALSLSSLAEEVRFEPKTVGKAKGEAGPTPVLQFEIGDRAYSALGTPGWRWTSDAMGFDAAALGPGSALALIGVRVEKLVNGKGERIEKPGPEAWAALRKKWDAEVAEGRARIISWEGATGAEEVVVHFKRFEEGRELEGRERSFFGGGRCITLGMLSDARQLPVAEAMFAQFNGSFTQVER